MSGAEGRTWPEGGRAVPAAALGRDHRHVDACRQRRPDHPAMPEGQQLQGRHPSGRTERRANRRPAGAEKLGRIAGRRRSRGVHTSGRGSARGDRGLRAAQGRLSHGVRRRLRGGRRQRDAGGGRRQPRARRGSPWSAPTASGVTNNVDGMMLHMLYAPRGIARRRRTASPSSARAAACSATSSAPRDGRGTAAVLRDLDRQRGRPRDHRLPRIPDRTTPRPA